MSVDSKNTTVFAARRQRLVEKLDGQAILVSNLVNVRYLTGFTGSNAFLLISSSVTLLLTDGRYVEQVANECPDVEASIRPIDGTMEGLISTALADHKLDECLIESGTMTVSLWNSLNKELGDSSKLLDSSGIVEELRSIKDEHELALIRRSVQINEAALLATLKSWSSSWTELEFSWHLEREIRQRGGNGFSFDPIVASGPSSALPHYHAGATSLSDHPFLLVDWGTKFQGYASDLTRMVAVTEPPEKLKEIHKVVSDAKLAAAEAVCDGAELKLVDSAARQLIADAGFSEFFNHGLGHGFGLEIHETPFLSPAFDGVLKSGMVITIEPGIYLPGEGGVRLEDDYLVTADGCEKLSTLHDDFLAL